MNPVEVTLYSCGNPDCEENHFTYEAANECRGEILAYTDYRCGACGKLYAFVDGAEQCCKPREDRRTDNEKEIDRVIDRIRVEIAKQAYGGSV